MPNNKLQQPVQEAPPQPKSIEQQLREQDQKLWAAVNTIPTQTDWTTPKNIRENYKTTSNEISARYHIDRRGKYHERYKEYIPGIDNDSYWSAQQTTGERWRNFGAKFAIGAGLTVGEIGARIALLATGDFKSLFSGDAPVLDWFADQKDLMQIDFPNYLDEYERNMNFGQGIKNIDFWGTNMMTGLNMITGMVLEDAALAGLTSGYSIVGTSARRLIQGAKLTGRAWKALRSGESAAKSSQCH